MSAISPSPEELVDGAAAAARSNQQIPPQRHYKGEYPCAITPAASRSFLSILQGRRQRLGRRTLSSGVAGLDEMTHGGWLRNSIVIVRGPPAAARRCCGVYARAGVRAMNASSTTDSKRPAGSCCATIARSGWTMQPASKQVPQVICRYPEATSLEDLLVDLRLELEELSPHSCDRQHLFDRARLLAKRLSSVHDRRRIDPPRARPEAL